MRHVTRAATVAMSAVLLVVGVGAGPASALQYDNVNPQTSSCNNTAKTVDGASVTYRDEVAPGRWENVQIAWVELRYSTACRTVWARITTDRNYAVPGDWAGAQAWIQRNSDGKVLQVSQESPGGRCNSSRTVCWTNMLNDAGVTSYATGHLDIVMPNTYARTINY